MYCNNNRIRGQGEKSAMTIQQLQYILEVERTGSVSQAAKNFYVSQSSVSNAISALENELGFPIFARTWQGTVPTENGLAVLEDARHICEHHRRILTKKEEPKKEVRILSALHSGFSAPFVRLARECVRGGSALVCERVTGGGVHMDRLVRFEADLFLTMTMIAPRFQESALARGLELTDRATLPMVARIGPGHRLYHKEDLTLSDLKSERVVDSDRGLLAKSKNVIKAIGHDPERAILVGEHRARCELVAAGVGFSIGAKLPRAMDEQYGFRNLVIPDKEYHVLSVCNPLREQKPEVRRYLELLDETLEDIRLR